MTPDNEPPKGFEVARCEHGEPVLDPCEICDARPNLFRTDDISSGEEAAKAYDAVCHVMDEETRLRGLVDLNRLPTLLEECVEIQRDAP